MCAMETPRIQVLPEETINQIAAGEVVENPASVVKELLENALDAGATRIGVLLEEGGIGRVEVWDDGWGMSPEEARLALQRHATSKIRRAEDLDRLATLGFRGEALPSIASVSRFTLVSRRAQDDAGIRIEILPEGLRERPEACPAGTRVIVEDLFHNVPARRKFQRGERAQVSSVTEVVVRAALARPDVHFTLSSQGRGLLDLPPCPDLASRAPACLGREALGRPVSVLANRPDGIAIEGVLGEPSRSRADSSRLVLLVNGRPVQDLGLRRSVLLAYGVLVPPGRFPAAVLHLRLRPEEVDVNVHPRKIEVRFRSAREVQGAVFEACREALASTSWVGDPASFSGNPVPVSGSQEIPSRGPGVPAEWDSMRIAGEPGIREALASSSPLPSLGDLLHPPAPRGRWSSLRYVGQVGDSVLVLQGPGTMVLVDQHAAHERVHYDALWRGIRSGTVAREALLFPEVVRLEDRDASRLAETVKVLSDLGFDAEAYGGSSVVVRALPAVLRGKAVAPAVREVAAALADDSVRSGMEPLEKAVATVACHASVRAGDPLGEPEVRALLQAMDHVEDLAAYCPHGRQAVVVFPLETVLRWFGR